MGEDTILEGCEILCLTGDLIECPLSDEERKVCKGRLQYEAGRREVVEWIVAQGFETVSYHYQSFTVHTDTWQAKLKEWGIEEVSMGKL